MEEHNINILEFSEYGSDLKNLAKILKEQMVKSPYYCVVQNFPITAEDQPLIELAGHLGTSIEESRNINGGIVYRVEVNMGGKPTYATTPYEFPCHTDCADRKAPPEILLLLCERVATEGGNSYIIDINDCLSQFEPDEIDLLAHPFYPYGNNFFPILTKDQNNYLVRYNRVIIDTQCKIYNMDLGTELNQLLDKFDRLVFNNKQSFKLQPGELLVMNNVRLLHGREKFSENSRRLLKRVRIYQNN